MNCSRALELGAEFAVGILAEPERTLVSSHLEVCSGCRREVDELTRAADAVLLAAPAAEPPVGFEAQVIGQTGDPAGAAPGRARLRLGLVAATIAAAALVGLLVGATIFDERAPEPSAEEAALHIERLVTGKGREAGYVFIDDSEDPWIAMMVDASPVDGRLACRARLADGRDVVLGSVSVVDGVGTWRGRLWVEPDSLRTLRLVDGDGATIATGQT